MFSSAQAVFLFDVNSFSDKCQSESELEQNVAKLKLGCLKLLTEFGAQTEKGIEGVRWSAKFYHSSNYKPNTNRKSFVDFTRSSFEEFENAITDNFCDVFDRRQSGNDSATQPRLRPTTSKSHCFILKKALQEILLDYNWDGPDISSPVKKTGGRRSKTKANGILPENVGPYNTVVVFTKVPQDLESVREFIKGPRSTAGGSPKNSKDSDATADGFLGSILDSATFKSFQEDKIHLNFVGVNVKHEISPDCPQGNKVHCTIHSGLGKLGGGLHLIENIVEATHFQTADHDKAPSNGLFVSQSLDVHSISLRTSWWRKAKGSRPRRPQKGPTLVWEDAEGISNIQVELEVLAVHGSSARGWGSASVVAVMQSTSLSLLAMAGGTGHLYVCHAPNTVFTSIIEILSKHQLSMLLKLSCGGVAVLSPWAGGVGSLAVVSASGLATPPIINKPGAKEDTKVHPAVLKFVTQAVNKCLKGAPAHTAVEPEAPRRFAAHYTERWFKPLLANEDVVKGFVKQKATKIERLAMQERLQKKYRPQIPRALATGEIERVDLVDITQPPTDPEPSVNTKPNMSRAQQLVKKSHIVTAQQKVKEQLAEEEERVQATERRAALASEQARKSQALESHVLNNVTDPQNTEELKQSLVALRESSDGETDSFTTAQTIINLALMHIKNTGSVTVEDDIGKVLGDGVLQSAGEVSSSYVAESRLSQYKLQTILHLELLWLLGYSSSSLLEGEDQESRGGSLREHHIGEAVKHLRAISLNHNPSTMASFLQETLLENYGETLGEALVEIYEELNQPLPEELRILIGDINSMSDPLSVKSQGSLGPESTGTPDNADSVKSKEERRLTRHPSLMEASKHRLVVPITNRTLKRNESERTRTSATANKESSDNEFQKVRRNLFDWSESAPKSKLRRCHTIDSVPVTELRRSPRKKGKGSIEASLMGNKGYKKTPVKEATSSSTGLLTPKLKKGGELIPETPWDKIGRTVFTKKRIRKSTGTTVVLESPDLKRACRTTPRKLHASLTVTRRNTFYSGGRSRNWERAKTQLLADRIRGKSGQRHIDPCSFKNTNASQLFIDILSDGVDNLCDDHKSETGTPLRRTLAFELDEAESEDSERAHVNQHSRSSVSASFNDATLARNASSVEKAKVLHSMSLRLEATTTPIKKVRRALSLSTPSKVLDLNDNNNGIVKSDISQEKSKSPKSASKEDASSALTETPKRFNTSLCEMTPSKRVQFSLTCTPSKALSGSNFQTPRSKNKLDTPLTPKSILKTPKKYGNETPSKKNFHSPDMFASSSKKAPRSPVSTPLKSCTAVYHAPEHDGSENWSHPSIDSPFSGFSDKQMSACQPVTPLKTNRNHIASPIKISKRDNVSPIKVCNIACYEESEVELVSPLKRNRGSSKASLILHNTPTKRHQITDASESKPCKLSFDKDLGDTDGLVENSVNLDQDPISNIEMPQMEPDDIEYLNALMFGTDFDQNLDVSAKICESIDAELECNSKKEISSPLKLGVKSSGHTDSQTWLILPEKQESLEDENILGLTHDHLINVSASEDVEVSPVIEEKISPPSLDSILNQHLVDDADKNFSELQGHTLTNNSEELGSFTLENVLPPEDDIKPFELGRSPSLSPEIPLDYEQLSRYLSKAKSSDNVTTDRKLPATISGITDSPVEFNVLAKPIKDHESPEISDKLSESTKQNASADIHYVKSREGQCISKRRSIKRNMSFEESNEDEFESIFQTHSPLTKRGKHKATGASPKTETLSKKPCDEAKPEEKDTQQQDSKVVKEGSFPRVKLRRMKYASSTPITAASHKRKISSSETSEADNQENKKRKLKRTRRTCTKKERRKSDRICKIKRSSLKDISSSGDDENFEIFEEIPLKEKPRIFDHDSDFESPDKNIRLDSSKKLPLKNLENICNRETVANSIIGDTENYMSESSINSLPGVTPKTRRKRGRPSKMDDSLSPVQKKRMSSLDILPQRKTPRKASPNESSISVGNKKSPSQIKDFSFLQIEHTGNKKDCRNGLLKTKKRKRKRGVKLKLTKSGENYEVSNVNVSVESSDRTSESLNVETSDSKTPSMVSKSATPFTKKKKKTSENHCIITPLRFTRHMSKDLSVSPELFSQLIALSPERMSPKDDSEVKDKTSVPGKKGENEIRKRKRDLLRQFNEKKGEENINDHSALVKEDLITSEWTVQNMPGSPTLKTFIRKQKKKHAIKSSPRVELSPIQGNLDQCLIKPSVLSLLHLSVSPIVSNKRTRVSEQSPVNGIRPKSLRRLQKDPPDYVE